MKVPFCLLLLTASVGLVLGSACNVGIGQRERLEFEMYTLHASKGPVAEAQNMTLVFDYRVNPVDTVEITFVQMSSSLQSDCVTSFPTDIPLKTGFEITLSTTVPVQAFSATATIFGIRRGN